MTPDGVSEPFFLSSLNTYILVAVIKFTLISSMYLLKSKLKLKSTEQSYNFAIFPAKEQKKDKKEKSVTNAACFCEEEEEEQQNFTFLEEEHKKSCAINYQYDLIKNLHLEG